MDGAEQKTKIIEEALNAIRDEGVTEATFETRSLFLTAQICQGQDRTVAILEEIRDKFNNKPPWWKNRAAFASFGVAIGSAIGVIVDKIR